MQTAVRSSALLARWTVFVPLLIVGIQAAPATAGYPVVDAGSTRTLTYSTCINTSSSMIFYFRDRDCCNTDCSSVGYDACEVQTITPTPSQMPTISGPIASGDEYYYEVRVYYDGIPTVGQYPAVYIIELDDVAGTESCPKPKRTEDPVTQVTLNLNVKPGRPLNFWYNQGSKLGCGADSFQGGSCGSCGGDCEFPWPSVVNPVVYTPLGVPGGLAGPAGEMFHAAPSKSGCYRSRVEVFDTCISLEYDPCEYTPIFYARVYDKCGKRYAFDLGPRPVPNHPDFPGGVTSFNEDLDDGSQMSGEIFTNGATQFHFDYVDGSKADYSFPAPPPGKWTIGRGPTKIISSDGAVENETLFTYDLEEGGQVYDQVVTPDGSTWKYYHLTSDSSDQRIARIEQVSPGASYVEIDWYDLDRPSQIRVRDSAGAVVWQTDYTYDSEGKIETATRGNRSVEYVYAPETGTPEVITIRDLDQSSGIMTETEYDYREPAVDPDGDEDTLTTTVTRKHLSGPGEDQVTYFCFYKVGEPPSYTYWYKTYVRRVIAPGGDTTTYDADTITGRVNSVEDPSGLKTEYSYNAVDAITTVTYSKPGMTSYHEHYTYYTDGGSDTVWAKTYEGIHPADDSSRGNFTLYVRDPSTLWWVDEVKVDPLGGREPTEQEWAAIPPTRSFQYYGTGETDGLPGQLKKKIVPDIDGTTDQETTYKYTETVNGEPKRQNLPTQTTYQYWNGATYDTKTVYTSYDDMGRMKSTADAYSRSISYQYDALGRLRKTVYGAGVETEDYFACCTMDWTRDEDGRTTYYAYDEVNRVTKLWTEITGQSESLELAQYVYDAFGNIINVVTHSDSGTTATTTYTYDRLNRVLNIIYPSPLGNEQFGYDSVGNLLWSKDGNDKYTVFKYDDLHRLTDVYYNYDPGRGLDPPDYTGLTPDAHYTYYGGSRLVHTMTDASGTSEYGYDTQDRLTSYTPPQPLGHAAVTYEYNNLAQKISMSTSGLNVAYNYYANGWLKNVQRGGDTVASYTYDWVGNRTRVDFANSTWQTFDPDADPRYRLDNIHYGYRCDPLDPVTDNGGLSFTRDNSGNPLTWGDIANTYRRVYNYDKNNRLAAVNYPGQPMIDFTYDWVGNRINPGGFGYNAADQLTSANGHTYGYDGAGNLTIVDGSPTYTYTPANLLETAAGSSMMWDGAGNRVRFTSSTAAAYSFVYDPAAGMPAVIEEVTPTGSVYYIREPDGALIARVADGEVQYYHFDDLGSTLFLTGDDGTISDTYTYDAWGSVTSHTGQTQQPYQYVGRLGYYTHYQDLDFRLVQLGVRAYDPQTGRFTQQDPVGDGLNSYAYAENNCVAWIDPWGLSVGAPSFWESLIPVWGSGRAAINDFQTGHYWSGAVNAALAASDVFLVSSFYKGVAKFGWKAAGSHTWDATRKWLRNKGFAKPWEPIHHWLVPQRGAGKCVPDSITNQPWNLIRARSAIFHSAIHRRGYMGLDPFRRFWDGTPHWFKALNASYVGRTLNRPWKESRPLNVRRNDCMTSGSGY